MITFAQGIDFVAGPGCSTSFYVSLVAETLEHGPVPFTADELRELSSTEPVLRQRREELAERIKHLAELKPNWDREGGKVPSAKMLKFAERLGQLAIEECRPAPHHVQIAASNDGYLVLTLEGAHERTAELWIEDESGQMNALMYEGDGDGVERKYRIEQFKSVADWLCGEKSL